MLNEAKFVRSLSEIIQFTYKNNAIDGVLNIKVMMQKAPGNILSVASYTPLYKSPKINAEMISAIPKMAAI